MLKTRRAKGIVLAAILLVLGAVILAFFIAFRPLTIAVHGFEDRETAAFRLALETYRGDGEAPRLRLAGDRGLRSSLVGLFPADLVIFRPGAAAEELASSFAPIKAERLGFVSKSLRAAVDAAAGDGSKPYALPLVIDNLGISWNQRAFQTARLSPPLEVEAFETACAALSSGGGHPLLVAGGDDETLLALVGFLLTDRQGIEAYEALVRTLSGIGERKPGKAASQVPGLDADMGAALEAPLPSRGGSSTNLRSIVEELSRWEKAGWLPPEWLRFDRGTCVHLIEAGQASLSIEFLSQRRLVPYESISSWAYGRLAFDDPRAEAPLAARLAAAAVPASSRRGAEAAYLRERLLSSPAQDLLARQLGAAPAALAAAPPDALAGDARSWAAGSGRILLGLAGESGLETGRLAAAIRQYIVSSR